MMPVSGMCHRTSTGTCSSSGGLRMQALSQLCSPSIRMTSSVDSVGEEEETLPTFAEAKEEFEFWVEIYEDNLRDWPKEYRFKYKRGRESDVLAYLILETSEQKKFQN